MEGVEGIVDAFDEGVAFFEEHAEFFGGVAPAADPAAKRPSVSTHV